MTKIYVYPGDRNGCGYYRLIWPAMEAARRGHDVEIRYPDARDISATVDFSTKKVLDVTCPADADVLVFQRLTNTYMAQAVPMLERSGVACVVDQDDDLSRVAAGNPAHRAMDPKRQRAGLSDHSYLAAEAACRDATLVTVSTPALLKRYGTLGNGVVVRNAVPNHYLDIEHHDNTSIGWPAIMASHVTDPAQVGGSISRLQLEGYTFAHIGDPSGIAGAFKLRKPFVSYGPADLLTEWPWMLSKLGVGVAPLDYKTEFNRAKSWLKPLELASVGVPVVMSPGVEYRKINEAGIGLLAEKPADWYDQVRRLLKDHGLRQAMSDRGRAVAAQFTISEKISDWVDAWELAAAAKKADRPVSAVLS